MSFDKVKKSSGCCAIVLIKIILFFSVGNTVLYINREFLLISKTLVNEVLGMKLR